MAQNGAVTLDTNDVSIVGCPIISGAAGTFETVAGTIVPEPGSIALFVGAGVAGFTFLRRRRTVGKSA